MIAAEFLHRAAEDARAAAARPPATESTVAPTSCEQCWACGGRSGFSSSASASRTRSSSATRAGVGAASSRPRPPPSTKRRSARASRKAPAVSSASTAERSMTSCCGALGRRCANSSRSFWSSRAPRRSPIRRAAGGAADPRRNDGRSMLP